MTISGITSEKSPRQLAETLREQVNTGEAELRRWGFAESRESKLSEYRAIINILEKQ